MENYIEINIPLRNINIFCDYIDGQPMRYMREKYNLTSASIRKIIKSLKEIIDCSDKYRTFFVENKPYKDIWVRKFNEFYFGKNINESEFYWYDDNNNKI